MNLLVINDYGISGGGAENRLKLSLDELLKSKKFGKISLIECDSNPEPSKHKKISIFNANRINIKKIVKEIIKEKDISLVQFHNSVALGTDYLSLLKEQGIPFIFFAHDFWGFCAKRILIREIGKEQCTQSSFSNCTRCIGFPTAIKMKMVKNLINFSTLGIAPSNFVKNLYEKNGVLRGKWKVVHPWIDLKLFSSKNKIRREKNLLFVGPPEEFKGAEIALRAMKFIVKEFPKIKLNFVGPRMEEGSFYRKKFEKIAQEDGVSDKIKFLGYLEQERLKKEYLKCGVCVFSSLCPETFGLVWAEASACGCAVIASKIGSIPELSRGKIMLFEAGNPKDLAQKAIELLSNEKKTKSFGKKAKEFAEKQFSPKEGANQLINLYEKII